VKKYEQKFLSFHRAFTITVHAGFQTNGRDGFGGN